MIVNRDREKLINAMIYFVQHTKHCHTLKLFKLLNFLDFEHFRQTGRSVTDQTYVAWKLGPAPNELWHELQGGGSEDLQKSFQILSHKDGVSDKLLFRELKPKIAFNKKLFTRRELEIMDRLVYFFVDSKSDDMTEYSHIKGLPWRKVFGKGEGEGKQIPIRMSLESAPIVHDAPTIEPEELAYRRELLAGLR